MRKKTALLGATAFFLVAACSSNGGTSTTKSAGTDRPSAAATTTSATQTLSGQLDGAASVQTRTVSLKSGQILLASVDPTAPLDVEFGVAGTPPTGSDDEPGSDYAVYACAVAVGGCQDDNDPYASGIDDPHKDIFVYYDDDTAAEIESKLPAGQRMLISNTIFRDNSDAGSDQWLIFMAPATGDYSLAVYPSSDGDSQTGSFQVKYRVLDAATSSAGFDNSGRLSAWYPQAWEKALTEAKSSGFFNASDYANGGDGHPYDPATTLKQYYNIR